MQQRLRLAVQIRTGIHQQITAFDSRNNRCKSSTLNAFQTFDDKVCADNNRTGTAAADKSVTFAFFEQLKCNRHRTFRFCLQQRHRVIMHRNHIRCMHNFNPVQRNLMFRSRLTDNLFIAGYNQINSVFLDRSTTAFQYCERRVISAKSVHYDLHSGHPFFPSSGSSSERTALSLKYSVYSFLSSSVVKAAIARFATCKYRSFLSRIRSGRGGKIPILLPIG